MTTATRYVGTCPTCEREHRLHKGVMVHHGYQRPGDGFIVGDCFGVGWVPWEKSPDGMIAYVQQALDPLKLKREARLARLNDPHTNTIIVLRKESAGWGKRVEKPVTLTRGVDRDFESELRIQVRETARSIEWIVRDIDERTRKIAAWKPGQIKTLEEVIRQEDGQKQVRRDAREAARAVREAKVAATRAKEAAKQQELVDLIQEYRDIFNRLAFESQERDVFKEAQAHWVKMHKRMNKKGYLHFYPHRLDIAPALVQLKLAAPARGTLDANDPRSFHYSNDLAWEPRV